MLDVFCISVAVGMEIRNCLQTLLLETVLGEPARCFREEEGHGDQDERENDLDDEGTLPGQHAGQKEIKSIIHPAGKHVASDEKGVFNPYHQASGMWSCDFCLDDGDGHGQESNSQALNGTTGNEGCKVRGEDLDEGAEEVNESTDADALLPADDITQPSGDKCTKSSGELETGH